MGSQVHPASLYASARLHQRKARHYRAWGRMHTRGRAVSFAKNSIPEHLLEGVFHFDPSDGIYRDHFPGHPIVPGSLIIHAFLQTAAQAHAGLRISSVENFRFKTFITPGHCAFRMEIKSDRIVCTAFQGRHESVTGVLRI